MFGIISVWILCTFVNLAIADNCVASPYQSRIINCMIRHDYDWPKFEKTTEFKFVVFMRGNRNIRRVPEDTFNDLSTEALSITGTGINFLNCSVFKGINQKVLRDLYLDDNLLSSVQSCSFQHVPNVKNIFIRNNSLAIIKPRTFDKLLKLDRLNLDNNIINEIYQGAFKGLDKLLFLEISRNLLTALERTIFQELGSLRYLDLSHNHISRIHPEAFEGLGNLKDLDLSHNSIATLDHTVFHKTFELSRLNIGHNHISEIHENTFRGLNHLYEVIIGSNNLNDIPKKLFASNPSIDSLDLSAQNLSLLSTDFFDTIPHVVYLNLSGISLMELPTGSFSNLKYLDSLDLSENSIERIHVSAFQNLPSLAFLGLSSNLIHEIKSAYFTNVSTRYINPVYNELNALLYDGVIKRDGLHIDLSSNRLGGNFWQNIAPILTYTKGLDLSNNLFGNIPATLTRAFKIDPDSVIGLKNCSLTSMPEFPIPRNGIDLSDNRLANGISLDFSYGNSSLVDLSNNLISSPISILTNGNLLIYTLSLSQNHFARLDRFPVFDKANKHILCDHNIKIGGLNLSGNRISYISPDACLGKVHTLDLSYNQLSVLSELLPRKHSPDEYRVKILVLNGNKIHQIEPSLLTIGDSLQLIYLSDNRLRGLEIFRNVLNRSDFQYLTLANNPLHCDCQMAWVRNSTISSRIRGARCTSPPIARGYLLECFPLDQCSPEQKQFSRYTPWIFVKALKRLSMSDSLT